MVHQVSLTFVTLLCLVAPSVVATETHWSLLPMKPTTVPVTGNPIDFFIEKKIREQNLQSSPEADRATLFRRISLDLTGLPPSPSALEAFLNDPRDTDVVYAEAVDKLLATPRYGERWAQHWLDVIRWAETTGFETNRERPDAWNYRDWVIAALNNDMPYDRFILEQIAGDTVGADAALGFLVAGPANLRGQIGRDEQAMRSARQDELDEVIRTVGQGFLGLTVGCARCHDHKFDPILQHDYYAMQAFFAGMRYGPRRLRGQQNDQWIAEMPAVQERLTELSNQLEILRKKHGLRKPLADVHVEDFAPVKAQAIRLTINATGNGRAASLYEFEVWSTEQKNVALASAGARPLASSFALENQSRHFDNLIDGQIDKRQAYPWIAGKPGPAWIQVDFAETATIERVVCHRNTGILADYVVEYLSPVGSGQVGWQRLADSGDRLPRTDDLRPAKDVRLKGVTPEQVATLMDLIASVRTQQTELARLSAGPQVFAANFTANPDPTWLLRRGDPMQRLEELVPALPAVLGKVNPAPDASESDRRLALARHLANPTHPLTTRVIVNRVWQHHFGTGLVKSPSDFGKMGATPSHPELLDWLALQFIEEGWSLKKLHRLIVNSRTYCQSSQPCLEALRVDADTQLLWRFPPQRLEAEAIRDCILSVSGKLNLKMGGPGFDFFDQRGGVADYIPHEIFDETGWRRMIYAHKIRMQAVDIFGAFDCPDAGQMTPDRTRSITPVQSLSLMNSPFVNRQAGFFAERVEHEVGGDVTAQVDRAFLLACSRPPQVREQESLIKLAQQHGLEQVCRALLNTSKFLYLQ